MTVTWLDIRLVSFANWRETQLGSLILTASESRCYSKTFWLSSL